MALFKAIQKRKKLHGTIEQVPISEVDPRILGLKIVLE